MIIIVKAYLGTKFSDSIKDLKNFCEEVIPTLLFDEEEPEPWSVRFIDHRVSVETGIDVHLEVEVDRIPSSRDNGETAGYIGDLFDRVATNYAKPVFSGNGRKYQFSVLVNQMKKGCCYFDSSPDIRVKTEGFKMYPESALKRFYSLCGYTSD